jgi:hypothetical protein
MQVFIIGTPLETAMALSKRHLNNQINEIKIILDALNGAKAWSNHPCVLQYKEHKKWLWLYMSVLAEYYQISHLDWLSDEGKESLKPLMYHWNEKALKKIPYWHTQEYFDQMKRRLYTKDPEHYKQWAYLVESEVNWYFVDEEWRKYINGRRID